jgi:hypothetical protein
MHTRKVRFTLVGDYIIVTFYEDGNVMGARKFSKETDAEHAEKYFVERGIVLNSILDV